MTDHQLHIDTQRAHHSIDEMSAQYQSYIESLRIQEPHISTEFFGQGLQDKGRILLLAMKKGHHNQINYAEQLVQASDSARGLVSTIAETEQEQAAVFHRGGTQ